jgi:2-dehydropantoate 2-reductase
MKIAVMGAGGIGGYVGGRLAEAGEAVHFIARGRNLEALRRNGLRIECPLGDATLAVAATDDPAAIGPVDLVLVAVKLGATDAAARKLAPLIGENTRIVTLQNGIDARELIARHVEEHRISAGSMYLSAVLREPGVVHSPGGDHQIIVDGLSGDPVIAAFVAACQRAIGLNASATDDIGQVIWSKFAMLVAISGTACLARSPVGTIVAHPETLEFLRHMLAENLAVARGDGQDFDPATLDGFVDFFRGRPTETKPSMLVDLEAGRPLEMPWLQGRLVELGRSLGIETPANTAVVAGLAPHVAGR